MCYWKSQKEDREQKQEIREKDASGKGEKQCV